MSSLFDAYSVGLIFLINRRDSPDAIKSVAFSDKAIKKFLCQQNLIMQRSKFWGFRQQFKKQRVYEILENLLLKTLIRIKAVSLRNV